MCFYLYLCKDETVKNTEIERAGVGGWEFGPLTVNTEVLNKDSELILNVCIYVFNFWCNKELGRCVFPYPGYVNHYFPCGRVNSQWGFLGCSEF